MGHHIVSVEIRDIEIPPTCKNPFPPSARGTRVQRAHHSGRGGKGSVGNVRDAARTYKEEDAALQLRAMSFVADSVKEKGGLVVVPSALSEAFEGLEKIAKG